MHKEIKEYVAYNLKKHSQRLFSQNTEKKKKKTRGKLENDRNLMIN